jgi:hypothetical protein
MILETLAWVTLAAQAWVLILVLLDLAKLQNHIKS